MVLGFVLGCRTLSPFPLAFALVFAPLFTRFPAGYPHFPVQRGPLPTLLSSLSSCARLKVNVTLVLLCCLFNHRRRKKNLD